MRLAGAGFADVKFENIARNFYPGTWFWEDNDRFFVNQFGHPYHGSTYFAGARINGFNFYGAIPFALLGSLQWETLYERESAINDVISTVLGGVSLGEILHRLFLELDARGSTGAAIGGVFVSPFSGFNGIFNRPKREDAGGNIHALSFKAGTEKSFPYFEGRQNEGGAWHTAGGYLGVNVIYGNPFVQASARPYHHFEFDVEFAYNIDAYRMQVMSDGYLFSLALSDSGPSFTSTGLSLHYDFFNATNDIIDNEGPGNIPFSSNALAWSVKHARSLSDSSYISLKAHGGIVLWGNSTYIDDRPGGGFAGDIYNTYGAGETLKLFFGVSNKKAGTLKLSAAGYHIFAVPVNGEHSTGSVFFLYSALSYDVPLGRRIGLGAQIKCWNLYAFYDAAENISRRIVSAGVYTSFVF
ncbi:MAG: DUF3943 domain-containing protein [Spirochaetaceae bacterium]|jgi:hypothetical protein|nr:DUF3943 domain-containing protein [Spirochaetaceae bacterium]